MERNNMKSKSSPKFMTRILWSGVAGLFAMAEIVAVIAFRKIPNDPLFPGPGTKYWIIFIVAIPMIAGLNGYYSVKRRLSSAADDVMSALSAQFLMTIIAMRRCSSCAWSLWLRLCSPF
jgi:hypothetical protein